MFNNPNNPSVFAYYQTRASHYGVVTRDWLAQAQAAVGPSSHDSATHSDVDARGKSFSVIEEFNNGQKQPNLAEAVAAIRALAAVIRSGKANTMMELEMELKKASDSLKSWDSTSISLTAGCDLFMWYVMRTSALEYEDFNYAKSRLIERADKFGEISYKVLQERVETLERELDVAISAAAHACAEKRQAEVAQKAAKLRTQEVLKELENTTSNLRVTPKVIRDVCLLARMMAANLCYSKIQDLMFESKLQVGDVVKCCVKKIIYFGIFVEVEGVTTLVHQTEVSWDATLDHTPERIFLSFGCTTHFE